MTAPKAQATPGRNATETEVAMPSNRNVNLQWAAVVIIGLVILGLVIVLGSDTGGNVNHVPVGGHG